MEFLRNLEIETDNSGVCTGRKWHASEAGNLHEVISPADGRRIAFVRQATEAEYETVVKAAQTAFSSWRMVPAPKRGEIVRQIGLSLRDYKENLGRLVSYEMGKSLQEGLGEVQEMIDICDFAVGQSRMVFPGYGASFPIL